MKVLRVTKRRGLGPVRIKKGFPETVRDEASSSFRGG